MTRNERRLGRSRFRKRESNHQLHRIQKVLTRSHPGSIPSPLHYFRLSYSDLNDTAFIGCASIVPGDSAIAPPIDHTLRDFSSASVQRTSLSINIKVRNGRSIRRMDVMTSMHLALPQRAGQHQNIVAT